MPYRHAHFYLLLLFPLAALAFWPNYFSIVRSAPFALHAHGVTAASWIALLAFQSWSIHRRRNALHRATGLAGLALFPFFVAGGLLVIQTMAAKVAAQSSPFYDMFGAALGLWDMLASLAILYLVFMAVRLRRKVQLHARYMLATAFFLISPILGRLMPILPPLSIEGPADFYRFGYGLHLADAFAAGLALILHVRAPAYGRPFLTVAAVIAAQSLLFEAVGRSAGWQALFVGLAAIPAAALAALGLAAGAAVVWTGWSRAGRPTRPAAAGGSAAPAAGA